jgi:primosomal protein N' (replication factor Y) (superfamily II helicase)
MYYEIAPLQIVRKNSQTFTYHSEKELAIGAIVTIEVGAKERLGIILQQTTKPSYPTKTVSTTVETTPLPSPLLALATWMSEYYATHLSLVLQLLIPRGITKSRRQSTQNSLSTVRNRTKIVFNNHQEVALQAIRQTSKGTLLLHGVTGSGKTAIYIQAAKETLAAGHSVIILVPEIALTPQIVDELNAHFQNIYVTHSHQTEATRHTTWKRILDDPKAKVVIGPRSALFLPVTSVGLIVIDEAHEPSYKQEQSPRYSALRVASILGAAHGAKVIIGSATPSVVDYYLATQSSRPIISLPVTARTSVRPSIELVDMKQRENFLTHPFLSVKLLRELEATLASNHQALFFHNRRGSTKLTLCNVCGWQATCPRCFVPLTLHADHFELRCTICGFKDRVPTSCPVCHNGTIIHKGVGTKMIETELHRLYPKARIARFDGDTDSTQTLESQYKRLYEGEIDIIIGTQIIAKGLDLPRLRMVGIVQADAGLALPDYSTAERTFQLLTQAIGRVGRSHHKTSVVIQSFQPTHPSITDSIAANYKDFYEKELESRKKAHFPPYVFLLKLTCTYKSEASAIINAKKLAKELKMTLPKSVEILGPAPAFYEKQRDTFRWQLVLKATTRSHLLKATEQLPSAHWQFELDPVSLL